MEDQLKSSWQNMLDRLADWLNIIITNLPNLVLAVMVFTVAYWLSQNLRHWLEKPMRKIVKQASVRALLVNIISIFIIAVGLFLALGILNLDKVLTSLLAGAGVAGLAVGLALQGTLSNTFSGVFLAVKDVLNVGDYVETNGYSGTVEEITLRSTKIKEADNNIVIIPNKIVLENPFKNYGLTRKIRVTLDCGVSYDSDLKYVKDLTIRTLQEHFSKGSQEKIEFHYLTFGGSSIDFRVRFWLKATSKLTEVEARSSAIMLIKEAYEKNNIDIPYPTRTLQIEGAAKELNTKNGLAFAQNEM